MAGRASPGSVAAAQEAVAALIGRHRLGSDPDARTLDLASEVGELAKALLEATGYGTRPFERTSAWDDELGDVAFSLLALAAVTETPLDAALGRATAKIEARVAGSGSASSGHGGQPV